MDINFDEAQEIINLMKQDPEAYQEFIEDLALKRLAVNEGVRKSWQLWFKIQ